MAKRREPARPATPAGSPAGEEVFELSVDSWSNSFTHEQARGGRADSLPKPSGNLRMLVQLDFEAKEVYNISTIRRTRPMPLAPIYTPQNVPEPAYHLRYTWSLLAICRRVSAIAAPG